MDDMKYTIGRFAAILGIDADTIRYYEKVGILQSRRDENNYRYYTDTDCRTIMTCRELRALGFSIRQIQRGECDFTSDEFASFIDHRKSSVNREIALLNRINEQLSVYREAAQSVRSKSGWSVSKEPQSFYYFRQTDNDKLVDHQSTLIIKRLMDMQPLAFRAGIIEKNELLGEKPSEGIPFECGLMIEKSSLHDEDLIKAADRTFTWNTSARVALMGRFSESETGQSSLWPYIKEIEKSGYRITGDAVSRVLPSNVNDSRWYLLYNIPIQQVHSSPEGE